MNPRRRNRLHLSTTHRTSAAHLTNRVLMLGVGVAIAYWIAASVLYALTRPEGTFFYHFFHPGMNEVFSRLLVFFFFLLFGSQVGQTLRQRQKLDEALAGSEEKHRTILENIEDGYYEIDRDGKLTIFNDSFRKITGYDVGQLEMQDYGRLLTPAETDKVFNAFKKIHDTGKAIKDLGFVIVRKDGARRWVETSISPITGLDGELKGYRGILRDVTRRRQADALKQEKMAAETASRSKSEFLANMSHEIRTPLNAIIGLVELLLGSPLSREQREDLKVVQSAAYALLSVINDILDFSKIEAGKLELDRSPFNLRDFLGEALKILAVKAHEKNLELAYRVAPDVPDRLIGDHHRFRQVLLNLIGNAVKFTDAGEIVVFAQRKSLELDRLLLHVAVRDTGVGIPTGKQALIFEAFRQADGSTSRKYGGTGLGLAVSAQLVRLMGGKIGVKSVLGEGSIFHFTMAFDVEPQAPTLPDLPTEVDLAGLRILVVDDNATNLKILCEMLASWKMVPRPASTTEAANRLLNRMARRSQHFDLALIDTDLADRGGAFALVQRLRGRNPDAPRTILMLTTTTAKDAARFNAVGVDTLVTKPVRPSDLLDAVIQALTGESVPIEKRVERQTLPPDQPLPPLDILVAEDTPFNQKYIKRLLDTWNCRTTIVANGRLAIEALAGRHFDLVLMDVQMPEMDGLTATMRIREQEPDGRRVPIIAMTAHAMRGDRERCIEAGMDDYVPKPIASVTLLKTIWRVLPLPAGGPEPSPDETAPADGDELAALLSAFNNDVAFFKDVAEMFISDYPPMLETVGSAIGEGDWELVGRTAHALKGMARNFQVDDAAETALALEQLAQTGGDASAQDLFHHLVDELRRFERHLTDMVARAAGG